MTFDKEKVRMKFRNTFDAKLFDYHIDWKIRQSIEDFIEEQLTQAYEAGMREEREQTQAEKDWGDKSELRFDYRETDTPDIEDQKQEYKKIKSMVDDVFHPKIEEIRQLGNINEYFIVARPSILWDKLQQVITRLNDQEKRIKQLEEG